MSPPATDNEVGATSHGCTGICWCQEQRHHGPHCQIIQVIADEDSKNEFADLFVGLYPRMMLHAWMLRLPLPATRARPHQPPICIASFDPFPAAGGAAGRAAWARRGAGAEAAPAVRAVAEVEP